jgi:hypothetical protein
MFIFDLDRIAANRKNEPRMQLIHLVAYLALVSAAVLFAYQTFSLHGYISSDYKIFYSASERYLKSPYSLYLTESAFTLSGYIYPPLSIFFFLPLTLTSMETSFFIFSWLAFLSASLALIIWMHLLVKEGLSLNVGAINVSIVSLALVTGPIFNARGGQVDTFVLLFCVAFVSLLKNKPALAALMISVGAWIKLYPVLLVVYAASNRASAPLRILITFFMAAFGILTVTLLALPWDLMHKYLEILAQMSGRTIINIDNQSLSAISIRVFVSLVESTSQFTVYPVPSLFRLAIYIGGCIIVGITFFSVKRREKSGMYLAAIVMAIIPLVSPLGWGHTYAYALPLFCLVASESIRHSQLFSLILLGFAYVALVIPTHHTFFYLQGIPEFVFHILFARYAIATLSIIAISWRLLLQPTLKTALQ